MDRGTDQKLVRLDVDRPIWDRFFAVAPLVIVGTREADGSYDLAPKHMAMAMGWSNIFGFMCTPAHRTCTNSEREGCFAVSFPRPDQVVLAALSATPRCEDDTKPAVLSLPTFPASTIDARFIQDAYLFLECRLERIIDGFDRNSLVVGRVVAAHVDERALRVRDEDDQEIIERVPLLAYLAPGRCARIDRSYSFPFPAGFKR